MKIISCASYYGSGSSVITDFVSEFESVYSYTNEEFRFVQDPDGISDLEYNLVENFNRHNSGYALKKYKQLVDFYTGDFLNRRYDKFLQGNWKKLSYQYIENLTDFKYHGWWQYDLFGKGKLFYFRKRFLNKIIKGTIWHNQPERSLNNLKEEITYCSHPSEEKFLRLTREYIDALFSSVSDKDIVVVDQLVPPSNNKRFVRYFNNLQAIIVDRDPRDIYLLEKYVWKDGVIPANVRTFCKWFLYTRDNRQNTISDDMHFKYIQFEDMVYKYDETTNSIENWLGLKEKDHLRKREIFNPNVSKKNTRLWEKINCDKEEINYIEKHLSNYLYSY
ncbi:hypothetical protein DVR01_04690 [Limosilactobacillus fermentum]|uniref:hypothetical protein n=1 Tax=Limosilactobacillus fermentum TaxID=1613 RepID=UPI000F0C962A|nr:hypothetical protein [Limosilactobacillus fermentum]AYP98614.1 hypothetical protein DVR01_04690 [Limosilactobacillus fermentum]